MQENGVRLTKKLAPPTPPGIYYRVLCMTGENKGVAYYLEHKRIIMGRGRDANIQILDANASKNHAELVKHNKTYILTDLKSQNGVIINDLKVNQQELSDNDKFIIGKTVFKFNKFVIQDIHNHAHNKQLENSAKKVEKQKEAVEEKSSVPSTKKKRLLMIPVIAVIALFLFSEEDKKEEKSEGRKIVRSINNDLNDLIQKQGKNKSKEIKLKTLEYIHRGQREFREGNYFRAIEEFNLALISDSNNGDALFYLSKTKQALDNHIKEISDKGAKEYGQLKYVGALKSYCEIIRLLERYPHDQRYQDAKNQIEVVEQKIGYDKGEYKCWE